MTVSRVCFRVALIALLSFGLVAEPAFAQNPSGQNAADQNKKKKKAQKGKPSDDKSKVKSASKGKPASKSKPAAKPQAKAHPKPAPKPQAKKPQAKKPAPKPQQKTADSTPPAPKKPEPKKPEPKKPEPKPQPKQPDAKPAPKKPEPKPEAKKADPKPAPKPEPKQPEPKSESKPQPKKPEPKPQPKSGQKTPPANKSSGPGGPRGDYRADERKPHPGGDHGGGGPRGDYRSGDHKGKSGGGQKKPDAQKKSGPDKGKNGNGDKNGNANKRGDNNKNRNNKGGQKSGSDRNRGHYDRNHHDRDRYGHYHRGRHHHYEPRYGHRRRGGDEEKFSTKNFLLGAVAGVMVGAVLTKAVSFDNGTRQFRREDDRVVVRHMDRDRFVGYGDPNIQYLPDGRTREVYPTPDGTEIVTVRDPSGRMLTRARRYPDGYEEVLIDDLRFGSVTGPVDLGPLPPSIPRDQYVLNGGYDNRERIETALMAPPVEPLPRTYSLEEVRQYPRIRERMPRIDLTDITFATDSAVIDESQIGAMEYLANILNDILDENPDEVFLIEGHTDAVGDPYYNLALSDRRAESAAIVLSDYYGIPPENMVTQGYGEDYLKVPTQAPERANRRVTIRRITPLIRSAEAPPSEPDQPAYP
ncbi:OmpA family protein [Methyloligella sp. 2.7D]|uniref:OmpA family protein n=1 Tax=unclassified Methyloligella TaxID=2625955 RepID=UPI00157D964C|nr:OmpA family protein [Methyloligella sp. GL2]QKP76915.1 OmpA family protein [Methyloligella sp. GL2]